MNTRIEKPSDAVALDIVTSVVREMSAELSYPSLRDAGAETPLFGGAHGIDSLSLVRIVAEVERKTEERLGKRVVLADERAMSRRSSPFRTVSTLAELLAERMRE
jgi:acyl carrier protein